MNHDEFTAAYARGEIKVEFDPHFLFQHALADKRAYEELTKANILRVTPINLVTRDS